MDLCEKHCKQIYKYGKITNPSSYNQNDKNEVKICESYALLFLKNKSGEVVDVSLIDLEDVDTVLRYKWMIGSHGYVPQNVYVDHINRNKLDNRKLNFRFCTNQENNRNKDLYSHNSSGIIGVTWNKERNKWQAQIVVNNKNINLGRFDDFENAVKARLDAEKIYFKDFIPLNRDGIYQQFDINGE